MNDPQENWESLVENIISTRITELGGVSEILKTGAVVELGCITNFGNNPKSEDLWCEGEDEDDSNNSDCTESSEDEQFLSLLDEDYDRYLNFIDQAHRLDKKE